MRKIVSTLLIIVMSVCLLTAMVGCNGNAKPLAKVPELGENIEVDKAKMFAVNNGINDFTARVTERTYLESDKKSNLAMSPIAIYMSLAVLGDAMNVEDRGIVEEMLGVDYDTMHASYAKLMEDVTFRFKDDVGKARSELSISNSIWLDNNVEFNQNTIDDLVNNYYCSAFSTKFKDNNKGANKAIAKFVKKNTHGLLNGNFDLSEDTIFTLLSTLYLKDVWNSEGDELPFSDKEYTFVNRDGSTKATKLLESHYRVGRVQRLNDATLFEVDTYGQFGIKFILPDEGKTVDEVMNSANIKSAIAINDFKGVDNEAKTKCFTRCYFPEYSGAIDEDISGILEKEYGFKVPISLDKLTSMPLDGNGRILHRARLEVDKNGIEGASAVVLPGCTSPGPEEYEEIYQDFVVDRAFGFIVSNFHDQPIFTGVVNSI